MAKFRELLMIILFIVGIIVFFICFLRDAYLSFLFIFVDRDSTTYSAILSTLGVCFAILVSLLIFGLTLKLVQNRPLAVVVATIVVVVAAVVVVVTVASGSPLHDMRAGVDNLAGEEIF